MPLTIRPSSLLLQLFLYATAISAILAIPLAANVASAKVLLPTPNVTRAYRSIRPPNPPGFQARVWQPTPEPGNMLHPLGVYFSVLIYFHQRGQRQGWTQPAELELYKIPPTRMTISVEALKHADPSIPTLSIGHVMLALDAGVAFMSETRSFYSTKIDVTIFEKPVGVLWILGMGPYPLDGTIANQTARSISNGSIKDDGFNAIRDDVPDSGVYTDNLIPGIELDYKFTPRKVKSEDIFTCLMEAFLIVTYEGDVNFINLNAVSAVLPPRLTLSIYHTDRLVPKNNVVGDLLWLVAQFYATHKRFDEMEFVMIIKAPGYPPLNRAAGFFMRLDGGAGVATS